MSSSVSSEVEHAPSGVDRMPPVVLGITLFIASECIFFSALFAGWFTARGRSPQWPPAGIHIDPTIGAITSALLILSSVAAYISQVRIRHGDVRGMRRLLGLTAVIGAVVIAGQGFDLANLNFTVHTNGFGTIYWVTSVIDSAHVAGAVIFALLVLGRARSGRVLRSNHVLLQAETIFWHFVVIVSIFTFLVLEVLT